MANVGALRFVESTDSRNRYAKVTLDVTTAKVWDIAINGTDASGNQVIPRFITIDNYQNAAAVYYNLDSLAGSVAPYSKTTLEISKDARSLQITLATASIIVWVSEQKLPLNDGYKYSASPSTLTVQLSDSGNWIIPQTWNNANNRIHALGGSVSGAAGGAARGGGGGAYARKENATFNPGDIVPFVIGGYLSGIDTTFNGGAFLKAASATLASNLGGLASNSVGDFKTNGGNGGVGPGYALLGGGGAGGPNANGLSAANSFGGAGDGGLSALGGAVEGATGGNGGYWTRTADGAKVGPGGGGAGGNTLAGGPGGNFGGGGGGSVTPGPGGGGAPGTIVIEWTP